MMAKSSDIDQRRMYADLAWAWPIISPPEDYIKETEKTISLLKKYARIPLKTALNIGCGGGHNDFTLKKSFEMTGADISESMLSLARRLNPEVKYVTGDMRSIRLGKQFDVVTIFDSIAYMRTEEELKAAFETAFSHLNPGGIFYTEVEEYREKFVQNKTHCSTHKRGNIEITFIQNYFDPNPDDNIYEGHFIYMIRRSGKLTIETDCHLLGVFEFDLWSKLLREVGFEINLIESGLADPFGDKVPSFVCIKPD